VDTLHADPREVTVVCLGPSTVLARALDRDPELPKLMRQIILIGGSWHAPGNASAVAEFRFYCDPLAARQVLRCNTPITLIPLDVIEHVLFSPSDLAEIPGGDTPTCRLLRTIAAHGIGASAHLHGIEGFYLQDVLGVCAVAIPAALKTKPMTVDVETRGEVTRGMTVFDQRPHRPPPNVNLVVDIDAKAVRDYMDRIFKGLRPEGGGR
jgi:inosine-uridine nucleoside N-ribohydrolase